MSTSEQPSEEERVALTKAQEFIDRELPGYVVTVVLGRIADGSVTMAHNTTDEIAVAMLDMAADSKRVAPKRVAAPGTH